MTKHETTRLSGKTALRVADLIRKHSELWAANGKDYCKYHEGWDDGRIAREAAVALGVRILENAVMRYRRAALGVFESKGPTNLFGGKGPHSLRLARLENEIREIKRHVGMPVEAEESDEKAEEPEIYHERRTLRLP